MAAVPRTTKSAHDASVIATCLTMPAGVSSLTVVRRVACSVVRPWTVWRRNHRWVASVSSRSARSPAQVGAVAGEVAGEVAGTVTGVLRGSVAAAEDHAPDHCGQILSAVQEKMRA